MGKDTQFKRRRRRLMKPVKIREDQGIDLSIKNLAFILSVAVAATIGWFQLENRIGDLETANKLFSADLLKKADQTPKNLEIFMLLEESFKQLEKLEKNQEQNMTNKVNIEFLKEQMNKVLVDIEKLKDKQRSFANGDH